MIQLFKKKGRTPRQRGFRIVAIKNPLVTVYELQEKLCWGPFCWWRTIYGSSNREDVFNRGLIAVDQQSFPANPEE